MGILKKGQEPIQTNFQFFLKQPDPLTGRKSNFLDKRDDFISDRAKKKKFAKNRPDMEVRTINFGKSRGGQVQSGQISGASVRTGSGLQLPGVLIELINVQ